jgi:hypothetical protein
MIPAALPEGLELPETVTHEPDNQDADRDEENCGQAAHCVLNRQPGYIFLSHNRPDMKSGTCVPGSWTLCPDL